LPGGLVLTRLHEITEQRHSEEKLRESEERFRRAVESMLDGFAICSPVRDEQGEVVDFRYEFVNDAACRLNDLPRERMIGHRIGELFPAYLEGELFRAQRRVLETGEAGRIDEVLYEGGWAGRGPVVRAFDSSIVPLGDGIAVSWRDVTERRRLEEETRAAQRRAERIARVHATLSMAYEAIVRMRERLPLFEEVSRVLVEQGRLRMAWVGEVDDHGWIVPVAHAGVTDGYLDDLRISVLDVPEGRGPSGTAARDRQHMFVADIATDERMRPWREAALARGYRASAAFPLVVDNRCAAVLTAYASEPGFFDAEEAELFDRMAVDLSFALEVMQREERRRALEAELRASEQRFRVAAESMLDSLTILAPVRDAGDEIVDFRLRYVNEAYCALVGVERERVLGRPVGELFPQFPGSERFELYRRAAATGEPCRTDEVQFPQMYAGTALASRVFDTVIASMGEELVVSARDVTERKRNEQELRLRAELLDLAHDAVIVRDPLDGRVTFWNREAEAMYGYSRTEAINRVVHELLATVFPDSREAVDDALAREGRWVGELRHTRKDGEVIVVSSRQALQREKDGRPIAIIMLNSDITERKRAEEELVETAGLLERTQQISKTGGWEYDLATSKLTWTDEVYRLYGSERRSGPVELERVISAFDAESAPIVSAALERLVADGEPCDLEVGLIRVDGQRIWVRVVGEAVTERGRVVRVRGIIADVNDRRLAEEEIRTLNTELEQRVAARTTDLEQVNHELETFAYSVSHDLRAPLRAVDGFSKVLLDDYAEKLGADGRHYLERVRAGAVRMGTLIDEILKLSRLSRQRFEREPIDISALAREIVAELSSLEPDRQVEVEIEDGLVAEADRGLVQSVLQNLLGNAFKFTARTGHPRIRFGAVEQDGVPVYFVSDNGAGFEMAHAKQLFRPFQRLHRESEFPGTGIGLPTVVRAVHRHGGTIWAHGAVNEGATFHFTLTPGAQPPADAATGEDVAPRWQPTDRESSS
jgi:PAS domain S-box-containing protein